MSAVGWQHNVTVVRSTPVLFVALLLLVACVNEGTMRTLTEEEAAQRADEHIQRAVAALPVEPDLTLRDDSSMACLDPGDNGPRGRYEVGKSYRLDGLPAGSNSKVVDALYQHWVSNDYRVLSDKRSVDDRLVSVEHNGDAFRMSVLESFEGELTLGASSPCVWPDGQPRESTLQPGGR